MCVCDWQLVLVVVAAELLVIVCVEISGGNGT